MSTQLQLADPPFDLRDYFAAAALQGFVANTSMLEYLDRHHDSALSAAEAKTVRLNIVGHLCYSYADAMLAARAKAEAPNA